MSKGSNRIAIGQTNLAILRGEEDVSLWSDDELRRGQRRDKNGHWVGRPPKIVPKAVHDELVRRTYDEAAKLMQDSLVDSVTLFGTIIRDEKADLAIRFNAAKYVADRLLPKEPIRVSVTTEAKWQAAITHSIVSLDSGMLAALESQVIETTEADYIAHDPDDETFRP